MCPGRHPLQLLQCSVLHLYQLAVFQHSVLHLLAVFQCLVLRLNWRLIPRMCFAITKARDGIQAVVSTPQSSGRFYWFSGLRSVIPACSNNEVLTLLHQDGANPVTHTVQDVPEYPTWSLTGSNLLRGLSLSDEVDFYSFQWKTWVPVPQGFVFDVSSTLPVFVRRRGINCTALEHHIEAFSPSGSESPRTPPGLKRPLQLDCESFTHRCSRPSPGTNTAESSAPAQIKTVESQASASCGSRTQPIVVPSSPITISSTSRSPSVEILSSPITVIEMRSPSVDRTDLVFAPLLSPTFTLVG